MTLEEAIRAAGARPLDYDLMVALERELGSLPHWRAVRSRVRVFRAGRGFVTAVEVSFACDFRGDSTVRILLAGMSVLHQVFKSALGTRWDLDRAALSRAADSLSPPGLKEVQDALLAEAGRLTRDPATVKSVKNRISSATEKRRKVQRRRLVSTLRELMDEGWDREDVLSAWDEATVREVHEK